MHGERAALPRHQRHADAGGRALWPLARCGGCLLYTSDAADERSSVDLGGRRIIKKKNKTYAHRSQGARSRRTGSSADRM